MIGAALAVLACALAPCGGAAGAGSEFVALSMRRAEELVRAKSAVPAELAALGGIAELLGFVTDERTDDVILVGLADASLPASTLDQWVVALRSRLVLHQSPLVSIDKTPESASTRLQAVRFEGGIRDTALGAEMIAIDIVLKELALGEAAGAIWGVPSYVDLALESLRRGDALPSVSSRFWFKNRSPNYAGREGVFAIQRLDPWIDTEVCAALDESTGAAEPPADPVGNRFAANARLHFDDLACQHPVLRRVRPILSMVIVAGGLESVGVGAALDYWLHDHPVAAVPTPAVHPLITVERTLADQEQTLMVSGGVSFDPLVVRLEGGELAALRQVVLDSRPSPGAWRWTPPLGGWPLPAARAAETRDSSDPFEGGTPGFSLDARVLGAGAGVARGAALLPNRLPSPAMEVLPRFSGVPLARPPALPAFTGRIGGVLLHGAARPEAEGASTDVDLSGGSFSLVIEGRDARLDPAQLRRWITALWATYFDDTAPGISIDPIAPGAKQHLVRYIGSVVNSDLGRVMRVTDYMTKRWWTGAERPEIALPDIDALQARLGLPAIGAPRRIWFVPEDMRFAESDGALVFVGGRMVLETEYVGNADALRDPVDEAFARAVTELYHGPLCARYPVFAELYDYAKLVCLGQHLRERGIPLLWFLMANKDLVLTEDSPSTVDALIRDSPVFEGIRIEGGVDLTPRARYVRDEQSIAAVRRAFQDRPELVGTAGESAAVGVPAPDATCDREIGDVHFVDSSALTAGSDALGVRYQTDVALRRGSRPGLELVRYFDPRRPQGGEFGGGWRLLVPYRIRPEGEGRIEFGGATLPERMVVENLLNGGREFLSFETERLSIAAFVPPIDSRSQTVALAPTTAGRFRLLDRLGNAFGFDEVGRLIEMDFSSQYSMQIEYSSDIVIERPDAACAITPAGDARVPVGELLLPTRVRIGAPGRSGGRTLRLSTDSAIARYLPRPGDEGGARAVLACVDGSYVAVDVDGDELRFDADGGFESVSVAAPFPAAVRCGEQRVVFHWGVGPYGELHVVRASVDCGATDAAVSTIRYGFDRCGLLQSVDKLASD